MSTPASLVAELERIRDVHGGGLARRKEELVRGLGGRRLGSAALIRRYHDALCGLRALPDDAPLLAAVEEALGGFERRPDLRRFRAALADTGIAGTDIHYRFQRVMAAWLARRHPGSLSLDWEYTENAEALETILPLLVPPAARAAFDEYSQESKYWLTILKGAGSGADWLAERVGARWDLDAGVKDALWSFVQPGFRLAWARGGPSRTTARHAGSPVAFVGRPLDRARPDIHAELRRPPARVRKLGESDGERILDLAREAMVVRHRDLDAFSHGNPRDVRMVELGDGLQLACVGMLPERRLLLEAVHGFLTLRNGVPIGYVLTSALFDSSEVAYNVFDAWRGGESARIYGRVLATAAHLFGSDSFAVDPYQLGHENEEGLASGAWWFYQKLGFRPKDPAALALMQAELRKMKAAPGHRSDRATLERLASAPMFFHDGPPREDVLGWLSVADVSVAVMRFLASRFGASLDSASADCAREARPLLGLPGARGAWRPRGWTPAECDALLLWAPLVLAMPGIERWTAGERRALAGIIRLKGGPDEIAYVRRFSRHARLRSAIVGLQRTRLSDPAPRRE